MLEADFITGQSTSNGFDSTATFMDCYTERAHPTAHGRHSCPGGLCYHVHRRAGTKPPVLFDEATPTILEYATTGHHLHHPYKNVDHPKD